MESIITKLIKNGAVLFDVAGVTPNEVYKNVVDAVKLHNAFEKKAIYEALCERESLMSTAVGNGIAFPHSRIPIIKADSDQRIYVVYLKDAIDMEAPDSARVYVMFIILSSNLKEHLAILSKLGIVIRSEGFRTFLKTRPNVDALTARIDDILTQTNKDAGNNS